MFVHGFYWQDKGKLPLGIEEEIEYCKKGSRNIRSELRNIRAN